MLIEIFLVAVGAGFGVSARVVTSDWIKRKNAYPFPLSTFFVNMSGSFLLGLVTGFGMDTSFSLLIGTGFLGSFTTFSTFNVENINLLRRKKYSQLFGYLGASYAFGIVLLLVGMALGGGAR